MRKPVLGVSDQVRYKPGCTAIEIAKGLKFRIKKEEGFYYLFSENKGYRTADLRLCFRICKKSGFLMRQLIIAVNCPKFKTILLYVVRKMEMWMFIGMACGCLYTGLSDFQQLYCLLKC